jgi:hypothetical protein
MDKKVKGSWLIHHTNKLQRFQSQVGYERVYLAGKAGILLSALSADKNRELGRDKVEALASAANINVMFELPKLLETLAGRELIDNASSGVSVLGVSTATTLQHTADIFEAHGPSGSELASLSLAEQASVAPIRSEDAASQLSDEYKLSSSDIRKSLADAEAMGFVDAETLSGNEKLLFNGNLFRRDNPIKLKKVLDSLQPGEQRSLNDLTSQLQAKACIEVSEVQRMLGKPLFEKVMSVGLFDVNVVSNSTEATGFVTLPAAFRKYSTSMVEDAFDLAKAFVSSITYGMTKSSQSRGRIDMVRALLGTLVRGEPIGPVPAIAEDYKILELKGVVRVAYGTKKGRSGPMMTLLKREVGEMAMQVISNGDVSEHSLDVLPTAAITRYQGPEENRESTRRSQLHTDPTTTNNILRVLRSSNY